MHRRHFTGEPFKPDLFHGEHQNRGQPCGQPVEHNVQQRARSPAPPRGWRIAIKAVFADIEIDRRQIGGGKGEQLLEHALKIIARIAVAHVGIQFRQTVQNPAFQFGHFARINFFGVVKPGKIAQQKPHGIAQAAVTVGDTFQNFPTDAQINRVIRLRHPQPQDIGTVFVDDGLGCRGIAQRFGHFHAPLIQRKAMRQHGTVRRTAHCAASLQH